MQFVETLLRQLFHFASLPTCWNGSPNLHVAGMCGRKNEAEIAKFSAADAKNYAMYEEELEKFVKAVDPLLGNNLEVLSGAGEVCQGY